MIKWVWEMETVEWPDWVIDAPQPKPVDRVKDGELRITYINHATILIQSDNINILTDPIWSDYAGPFSFLGSKRVRAPGVKIEDLPKIDIILISHDHYDHLDFPTLEKIVSLHHPVILTGLGVKSRLSSFKGTEIIELDWWDEYSIIRNNKKIFFVPSYHNSGRGMFDENKTLWGGYIIETGKGYVLFMGDTAFEEFFYDIKKRFCPIRLSLLPIGSYEKRWFMKNQHINPDDAARAHIILEAKQSIGIHFSTFKEHPEQTIDAHEKDLKDALIKYNIPESDFLILNFGEGRNIK